MLMEHCIRRQGPASRAFRRLASPDLGPDPQPQDPREMHRSGCRSASAARKSSSLAFGGVNSGRPSASARRCTGDGVSFILRPERAGGWLTTAATSNWLPRQRREPSRMISRDRAATGGVPRKTTFFGGAAAVQKDASMGVSKPERRPSMMILLPTSLATPRLLPHERFVGGVC